MFATCQCVLSLPDSHKQRIVEWQVCTQCCVEYVHWTIFGTHDLLCHKGWKINAVWTHFRYWPIKCELRSCHNFFQLYECRRAGVYIIFENHIFGPPPFSESYFFSLTHGLKTCVFYRFLKPAQNLKRKFLDFSGIIVFWCPKRSTLMSTLWFFKASLILFYSVEFFFLWRCKWKKYVYFTFINLHY